jgi:hypothetical protein
LNKVKYRDIHHHLFNDVELKTLQDIVEFLKVSHAVQTTLCGKKVPTLSAVLPTYKDLLEMLRAYKVICPQLLSAISVCIAKIEEYVSKSQKTQIYALAMSKSILKFRLGVPDLMSFLMACLSLLVINPITKSKWIEEHWTMEEYQAAKNWILESVCSLRFSTTRPFTNICSRCLNIKRPIAASLL